MPPVATSKRKAKQPRFGFQIVADVLDKKFYDLMSAKPPPPTADGNILTARKHLKTSFSSSLKMGAAQSTRPCGGGANYAVNRVFDRIEHAFDGAFDRVTYAVDGAFDRVTYAVNQGDAIAFYGYKDDGTGELDWTSIHCGLPTTEE